jgi:hypothetical protein
MVYLNEFRIDGYPLAKAIMIWRIKRWREMIDIGLKVFSDQVTEVSLC